MTLEIAMKDVERHAREVAKSDARDGCGPPAEGWIVDAIRPWAWDFGPDVLGRLQELWRAAYDAARAELDGRRVV
jgi:hypothetical protein